MTGNRNNGDTIPAARDVSMDIEPYAETVFGEAYKIATDKDRKTSPSVAEATQVTVAKGYGTSRATFSGWR